MHGVVGDLFNDKRRVLPLEKRIKSVEQCLVRTPIGFERVLPRGGPGRVQIGEIVCASESVNRLFGISNKKEPMSVSPKDPLKNRVLQRVRILELVDQSRSIFCTDCAGKKSPVPAMQSSMDPREQIVVGQHVALKLARGEFAIGIGEKLVGELIKERFRRGAEGLALFKKTMRGGSLVLAGRRNDGRGA